MARGAQWRHRAQAFQVPPGEWQALRPITLEQQGRWLLERLRLEPGAELSRHPDRSRCCPAWAAVISRLRQLKLVTRQAPLALTKAGMQYIDDLLLMQPDGQLGPPAPQVRLGAIATGSHVMRDPQLFDRLSESTREVLGVDMEAAAIGAIGHARKLPWVVMKGVMDHADHDKDDQFKRFAARAAAECLLAFLRQNLSGSDRGSQNPTAAAKKNFQRVHTLIEASDLAAADRELEQTVGTLRSSADYWYWKSRVAFARHNLDVASAYSEEALKQDPRHLHGIVLRIKLLLLSTKTGERQKVTELAQRSYGISDALDAWLRCVTSEEKFASGVCTNTELDARCPPPAHAWHEDASDY